MKAFHSVTEAQAAVEPLSDLSVSLYLPIWATSDLSSSLVSLTRRCSLSPGAVYSGEAHACISRQGWLWSSCPQALRVQRTSDEPGEESDRPVVGGGNEEAHTRERDPKESVVSLKAPQSLLCCAALASCAKHSAFRGPCLWCLLVPLWKQPCLFGFSSHKWERLVTSPSPS